MNKIYKRKLSKNEARRHFIYIESKYREMFPEQGKDFKIKVKAEEFDVSIDKQWRIWASLFWDLLFSDFPDLKKEGAVVTFSKNPDGSFKLFLKKTT